ncbi:MAG: SDR family oxidoreductase [Chloroflexi bacterium]|nr:SDR family oxidoreductase [Chloroflexota bacterium]
MNLKNKTALITGSGIRLGKAIALALADRGVNLAIHYNSSKKQAEEVQNLAKQKGVKAELFQADLSDLTAIEPFFDQVHTDLGQVDILINNASVYTSGSGMNTNASTLNATFSLNLFAPILLTRKFALQLPEDKNGKVINISDAKTFVTKKDHFAYRLTKYALNQMTRMFALELAPRITVNAIAPGIMLPLAGFEHIDMDELAEQRIPLKMTGSPEIVVENVIHILRQDFMTGSIITVDGGESLL